MLNAINVNPPTSRIEPKPDFTILESVLTFLAAVALAFCIPVYASPPYMESEQYSPSFILKQWILSPIDAIPAITRKMERTVLAILIILYSDCQAIRQH